jgi:hypothetical protein
MKKINKLSLRFMPTLKYLFVNATTSELRLLRGKTIECISLIGLAVGKEKVFFRIRKISKNKNFNQELLFKSF